MKEPFVRTALEEAVEARGFARRRGAPRKRLIIVFSAKAPKL
jgi:hypothetical protein